MLQKHTTTKRAGIMIIQKAFTFLVAAMLICPPLPAGAGSAPRLIPQKPVTLLATGLVVDKEIPAPSGMLLACSGECIVEADGLQLVGADKTVFALEEGNTRFLVTVMEGKLDFSLHADAKRLAFKTPFQDPADSNTYLVPASSDDVFRGSLLIDSQNDKAILDMTQGSLKLVAIDGQKVVHAGNAIFLPTHSPAGSLTLASGSSGSGAEFSGAGLAVGAGALGILAATGMALAGGGGGGGRRQ
jgi:hypothetical protein